MSYLTFIVLHLSLPYVHLTIPYLDFSCVPLPYIYLTLSYIFIPSLYLLYIPVFSSIRTIWYCTLPYHILLYPVCRVCVLTMYRIFICHHLGRFTAVIQQTSYRAPAVISSTVLCLSQQIRCPLWRTNVNEYTNPLSAISYPLCCLGYGSELMTLMNWWVTTDRH